jgi:hypothetical protein
MVASASTAGVNAVPASCAVHDLNGDDDVDLGDWARFQEQYAGA